MNASAQEGSGARDAAYCAMGASRNGVPRPVSLRVGGAFVFLAYSSRCSRCPIPRCRSSSRMVRIAPALSWRSLPVASLTRDALVMLRSLTGWASQKAKDEKVRDAATRTARELDFSGWRYDRKHFKKVVDTYRRAWRGAGKPTQAVADEFDVPYSTAAKWVARCRRPPLNLLGSTQRRQAGGITPPKPTKRRVAKRPPRGTSPKTRKKKGK